MFLLVASRSDHPVSNARAHTEQKELMIGQLFSGLMGDLGTFPNLLLIKKKFQIKVC